MLSDRIQDLSDKLKQAEGMKQQLERQKKSLEMEVNNLRLSVDRKTLAREVLERLVALENEAAIGDIQRLVTEGLRSVWGGDFEFRVVSGARSDVSTSEFKLLKDGIECDIINSHGGGMVQVISFLVRIIFLLRTKPELLPVILLDEPFVHVSSEYQPKVAELVSRLSARLNLELLMVTHQTVFSERSDHDYRISLNSDNEAEIELVR